MVIKVLEAPTFRSPITGQQAVTGTAAPLATHECVQIIVKALAANSIPVYIGPSTVSTSTGYELNPGDHVIVEVEKAEFLHVIAATTGASVCWIAKKVQ
jgi:hypothetical protein